MVTNENMALITSRKSAVETHSESTTDDRLRALLEGLEVENIDLLLSIGTANDFKFLGKEIARKCKINRLS